MGRLISVDYVGQAEERPEGYMFLFLGGVLTDDAIDRFELPGDELSSVEFVDRETALSPAAFPSGSLIA